MEFENTQRTQLDKLGEFGLIEHIAANARLQQASSIKGIGDDAAVIDAGNHAMVITSDMLVEGVHFDLVFHPLKHLGYKAIVVNLSDVFAMNALPEQVVVNIALSSRFTLEAVEDLYNGINIACEKYKVDLVGGDTVASPRGLTISVTAVGRAKKDELVYRNGAREHDVICVTGDLGAAYVGLQLLEREKQIFMENPKVQPDFEEQTYIVERQLKPEAQREIILKLKELGVKPTSMIDISDGLSSEILHICRQSGVGCRLYEAKLPIDHNAYEMARKFNLDPTVCAMNGGEDYELLFTVPPEVYEKIRPELDISAIGYITEKAAGVKLIDKSENEVEIKAQGWNAFRKR